MRQLLLTGENLIAERVGRVAQMLPKGSEIWNLFGGTEMPYVLAGQVSPERVERANTLTHVGEHISLSTRRPQPTALATDGMSESPIRELVVGGPAIFTGYLDPDTGRPAAAPTRHLTGDAVVPNDDGSFTVVGRLDRQVKINGVRVELDAVERELETHPGVRAAVAIRAADRLSVLAFIAPLRHYQDNLRSDLERHCRQRLSPSEIPSAFELVSDIPRTASGKKDRRSLEI